MHASGDYSQGQKHVTNPTTKAAYESQVSPLIAILAIIPVLDINAYKNILNKN